MHRNEYPMLGLKTDSLTSRIMSYGPVRNVYNWSQDIFRRYGTQNYDQQTSGKAIGMQIAHHNGRTLEQHIGYEVQDTPWKNAFVRGHEETHALHAEHKHDMLLDILRRDGVASGYRPGDYWKTSTADKEYFANLGGLYAMQRQGFDVATYGPELVKAYGAPQLADAVNDWMNGTQRQMPEMKESLPDLSAPSIKPRNAYALLESLMAIIYHMHTSGMRNYSHEYEMAK